jgi:hypothetical protein
MEAAARAAEAQAAGAAAAARSDRLERLVPSSVGEPEPAPAPTLSAASGGSEHGQSLREEGTVARARTVRTQPELQEPAPEYTR